MYLPLLLLSTLLPVIMPTVEVSHKLDLDSELPEQYKELARRQGEDPDQLCSHISDLRNLIYGKTENRASVGLKLIVFGFLQNGACASPIEQTMSICCDSCGPGSSKWKTPTNW